MRRMKKRSRKGAVAVALVVGVMALLAIPVQALAANVRVTVVGKKSMLLPPTTVEIGTGSAEATTWNGVGTLPHSCKNNTAYQAIEKAVKGNWDRELFINTILGETISWAPNEEYWAIYYDNNYGEWGACEQAMKNGDSVLMQAVVSGPESEGYVPQSIPIELALVTPASGKVEKGKTLKVKLTEWKPKTTIGTEEPKGSGHFVIPPSEHLNAPGYTVKIGSAEAVTNSLGEATLTLNTIGKFSAEASMPGSTKNYSRSAPVPVCVYVTSKEC
jgi:hypothetical protein